MSSTSTPHHILALLSQIQNVEVQHPASSTSKHSTRPATPIEEPDSTSFLDPSTTITIVSTNIYLLVK